jgi:excisionase family DNA binding protein
LQVSRKIVYQLIDSGQLDAFRPGRRHYRVLKEALQDYKNRCRSGGNVGTGAEAQG